MPRRNRQWLRGQALYEDCRIRKTIQETRIQNDIPSVLFYEGASMYSDVDLCCASVNTPLGARTAPSHSPCAFERRPCHRQPLRARPAIGTAVSVPGPGPGLVAAVDEGSGHQEEKEGAPPLPKHRHQEESTPAPRPPTGSRGSRALRKYGAGSRVFRKHGQWPHTVATAVTRSARHRLEAHLGRESTPGGPASSESFFSHGSAPSRLGA